MRPNERKACLAIALKVRICSQTLLFIFLTNLVTLELCCSLSDGEYGNSNNISFGCWLIEECIANCNYISSVF